MTEKIDDYSGQGKKYILELGRIDKKEREIRIGMWKIINFSNTELAKKLDIDEEAAAKLRGLAAMYLEYFFKKD